MTTYQEKFDQIVTVLAQVVKAKQPAVGKPPLVLFLLLPVTIENKLAGISRDELIKMLEVIERDKAIELSDWNYPQRVELMASKRILGTYSGSSGRGTVIRTTAETKKIDRAVKPPFDSVKNVGFNPTNSFENWHSAYLHQKSTDVSQLNNLNFEKVYSTVCDIDEELQMHPRPDVTIGVYFAAYTTIAKVIMASIDKAQEYREDALNYLRSQNAIESYSFGFTNTRGSYASIKVNIKAFQELKERVRELRKASMTKNVRTSAPSKKKSAANWKDWIKRMKVTISRPNTYLRLPIKPRSFSRVLNLS